MRDYQKTFVGLDVGTSKVACVIGLLDEGAIEPSIMGVGTSANSGVRKGVVVDLDDTVLAIQKAVEDAERSSGYRAENASVGVGGTHLKSINSKGVIAVAGTNRPITADDVARAEEAATVVQLPPNREIIQVFAKHYRLDGQEYIKDPIDMLGVRLEVDAHIITASTPAVKNLQKSVFQAGLAINQQEAVALASARAVLDKRQREHGAVLVDMGSGTTNIAVFEEGEILHTVTIPIGGLHVTNDLAIGFQTDIDTAEVIKCKHVDVSSRPRSSGVSIKTAAGETLAVDMALASEIVAARLEEILERVDHELDKIKRSRKLPAGVVLVGGSANQKGIIELAKHTLGLPAQVGLSKGFSGVTDKVADPSYAAAVGLMLDDLLVTTHHGYGSRASSLASSMLGGLVNVVKRLRP